jgi:hypothetical protein
MSQQQPPTSGGPPSRPNLQDILGFVRRYIPFSPSAHAITTGLKSGLGQYLIATFATAHTDTAFTLALGHIPQQFVECSVPQPAAPVFLPLTYRANGTQYAGNGHIVFDSVNATASTTTVTLTGNAAYAAGANYIVVIYNFSTNTGPTSPTAQSAASFTFASTNGDTYLFFAFGTGSASAPALTTSPSVTLPSSGTTLWTANSITLSAETAGTYLLWVS